MDTCIFHSRMGYSESTALLVKSLLLGLESIRRDYGAQYLEIAFKEV